MSATFRRNEAKAILVKATQDGIGLAADYLQLQMKNMLSKKGSGQIYIKPSGRQHQASAPGEPPAVDTGHYRRSIQIDVSQLRTPQAIARVGSNVMYGRMLEFGHGGVLPRPHWIPLLRTKQHKVRELIFKVIQKRIPGIKFA